MRIFIWNTCFWIFPSTNINKCTAWRKSNIIVDHFLRLLKLSQTRYLNHVQLSVNVQSFSNAYNFSINHLFLRLCFHWITVILFILMMMWNLLAKYVNISFHLCFAVISFATMVTLTIKLLSKLCHNIF